MLNLLFVPTVRGLKNIIYYNLSEIGLEVITIDFIVFILVKILLIGL